MQNENVRFILVIYSIQDFYNYIVSLLPKNITGYDINSRKNKDLMERFPFKVLQQRLSVIPSTFFFSLYL